MAQKPQLRVQMSPRIMKVAVRFDQHSPRFGQRALSQTVWSFWSRIMSLTSATVCGLGTRLVSQSGTREFKAKCSLKFGWHELRKVALILETGVIRHSSRLFLLVIVYQTERGNKKLDKPRGVMLLFMQEATRKAHPPKGSLTDWTTPVS